MICGTHAHQKKEVGRSEIRNRHKNQREYKQCRNGYCWFSELRCYTKRFKNRQSVFLWSGGVEKVQYNDIGIALNSLAREQMKYKLMADIRADIEVCKLEGIDYKEYLQELKSVIDGFLKEGGD